MPDWSKIGRSSREKGARFERKCRDLLLEMADCTTQEYYDGGSPMDTTRELLDITWRRTQAGHEQKYGDLIPIDKDGHHVKLDGKWTNVECKYRANISWAEVTELKKQLELGHQGWYWFLIIGTPLSKSYVFTNYEVPNTGKILGPCYLIG